MYKRQAHRELGVAQLGPAYGESAYAVLGVRYGRPVGAIAVSAAVGAAAAATVDDDVRAEAVHRQGRGAALGHPPVEEGEGGARQQVHGTAVGVAGGAGGQAVGDPVVLRRHTDQAAGRAEELREPGGRVVALVDPLEGGAEQIDVAARRGRGHIEAHRAVTARRIGRVEREPGAVGTDGGPDQGEAGMTALGAVDPVLADDHEAAVVRKTRRREKRIAHRRARTPLDGIADQLRDVGHTPSPPIPPNPPIGGQIRTALLMESCHLSSVPK